jgi:hypothetical protein
MRTTPINPTNARQALPKKAIVTLAPTTGFAIPSAITTFNFFGNLAALLTKLLISLIARKRKEEEDVDALLISVPFTIFIFFADLVAGDLDCSSKSRIKRSKSHMQRESELLSVILAALLVSYGAYTLLSKLLAKQAAQKPKLTASTKSVAQHLTTSDHNSISKLFADKKQIPFSADTKVAKNLRRAGLK